MRKTYFLVLMTIVLGLTVGACKLDASTPPKNTYTSRTRGFFRCTSSSRKGLESQPTKGSSPKVALKNENTKTGSMPGATATNKQDQQAFRPSPSCKPVEMRTTLAGIRQPRVTWAAFSLLRPSAKPSNNLNRFNHK